MSVKEDVKITEEWMGAEKSEPKRMEREER